MKPAKNTSENHPAAAQLCHTDQHDLESQNSELVNPKNQKLEPPPRMDTVYKRLMDDLNQETAAEGRLPPWRSRRIQFEIFILISFITILVVSKLKNWEFCELSLSSCTVLAITVFSGLSFIRLTTWVLIRPMLRRFWIHKYAVFFIYRVKIYIDVTLWFNLILLVWYAWFRPQLMIAAKAHAHDLKFHVPRFLIALILGAILWLLKNILYLKLEADLYYGQLFDRIQRSVVFLHGIQLLNNNTGSWYFLVHPHNKNIWMDVMKMKKETTPVRILECLSQIYLHHVRVYGNNPSLLEKFESFKDDTKLMKEARELLGMVISDNEHKKGPEESSRRLCGEITEKDLKKFGLTNEEMEVLFIKYAKKMGEDGGDSKQQQGKLVIAEDRFLNWVVRAYKSCSNMHRILSSSTAVFIKLNRLMSTFIITVVIIIWLIMSRLVDTGQIALVFSPFLAVNFMFGDSCKRTFDGLIFAFAMHPFDVGDRVIVDNMQMRADELNILTTVFYKYDTQELLVYPNSQLANKNIINLDITPDQADVLNFSIPEDTPLEDITDLEIKIKIALDEDPTYDSDIKVVRKGIVECRLQMAVHFKYLVSYLSNETEAEHKSNILTRIMEFCQEIKDVNRAWIEPSDGCDTTTTTKIMHFRPEIKLSKLKHVNILKREILSVVDKRYKEHSKVVMTKLNEKKEVEIAVYLRIRDLREGDDKAACKALEDAIDSKLSELKAQGIPDTD